MKDDVSTNLFINEFEGSQVSSKAAKWLKSELNIDVNNNKIAKKE